MMNGYENLLRMDVDGTDFLQVNAVAQSAFKYARQGKGPALVEAHVVRLLSHSSSDDQKKYRPDESLKEDLKKDPIDLFANVLLKKEILTELSYNEFKRNYISCE